MSGNDNAIDLAVYFTNGRYEKIRSDRLVIFRDIENADKLREMLGLMRDGYVVVNPETVCIIRKWNKGPYDDD